MTRNRSTMMRPTSLCCFRVVLRLACSTMVWLSPSFTTALEFMETDSGEGNTQEDFLLFLDAVF